MRTKLAATSAAPAGPQSRPATATGRHGTPPALWIAILLVLPLACEAVTRAIGIALPGGISGFVVLLVLLAWRGAPSPEVAQLAQGLIRWLPPVVVAPMVGIFAGNTLPTGDWLAIACGVTAGIVASQIVTGLIMLRLLDRRRSRRTDTLQAPAPSAASRQATNVAHRRSPPGAARPVREAPPRLAIVPRSV